jgi:hypothetical protein
VYLRRLRDPDTRKDLLLSHRVSPADFRSDEHLARMLAVTQMLLDVVKMRDAEVNKRFDQFCQERRKEQRVNELELGPDYEEVAFRHVYTALAHLCAAVEPRDCDPKSLSAISCVTSAGALSGISASAQRSSWPIWSTMLSG